MAKLKAPLMSLGATQQLGKALVFFPWKGLNVVREYVIPSNPRTTLQQTQRGYLTDAVDRIHAAQAYAAHPLGAIDVSAYALWGSTYPTPRTWFNAAVKNVIDRRVSDPAHFGLVFSDGSTTPGAFSLAVEVYDWTNACVSGNFKWGTSKTALINTKAATYAGGKFSATIAGLTTGQKYFWQLVVTGGVNAADNKSGIYYGYAA